MNDGFAAIVFSKDRSMQLDLLIRSIKKNFNIFDKIVILYKATNQEYKDGYSVIQHRYVNDNIDLYLEKNFKNDLIEIVNIYNKICFFTDDDVVFRNPSISRESISGVLSNKNTACISLRLGNNLTIQDIFTNLPISKPRYYRRADKYLFWNFASVQSDTDFGYPLSVDGHIYNKHIVLPLLNNIKFTNPNNMEGNLFSVRYKLPVEMCCLDTSSVVNIPANRVQNEILNRYSGNEQLSAVALNKLYLNKKQFKLSTIESTPVYSSHQLISLEIENVD